jgi:hypothetical protein
VKEEQTDNAAAKDDREASVSNSVGIADPEDYDVDHWEPRPPKVQMNDPNAVPLELHAQIQLYATTE